MAIRSPYPGTERRAPGSRAIPSPTADIDLPGPRAPVLWQSLLWLSHPPLRWVERLGARYGDTFRVRLLGPSYPSDKTWRALLPRTLVVLSKPAHLREVFARSRDEFLTGEANQFLGWHTGDRAIMVLDGAPHLRERHELHGIVHQPGILAGYESAVTRSLEAAFASWPERGSLALQPAIFDAMLDTGSQCIFGDLSAAELERIRRLTGAGAAANAVPPPLLLLPFTRRRLAGFGPFARVSRAMAEFDWIVAQQLARPADSDRPARMLDTLVPNQRPDSGAQVALTAQRLRLALGGFLATATASVWLCYHVLTNPEIRERVQAAADRPDNPESARYLDAVCRESLRLSLPFRGAFRRVAASTTLDGIALCQGTLLLPLYGLTHRRPELYPEPDRFRPERFLERSYAPEEYAPFGGGLRRCLGEPLALLQMRLLLSVLFRNFVVEPVGTWSPAERRPRLMIVPRDRLNASIRRREGHG